MLRQKLEFVGSLVYSENAGLSYASNSQFCLGKQHYSLDPFEEMIKNQVVLFESLIINKLVAADFKI